MFCNKPETKDPPLATNCLRRGGSREKRRCACARRGEAAQGEGGGAAGSLGARLLAVERGLAGESLRLRRAFQPQEIEADRDQLARLPGERVQPLT